MREHELARSRACGDGRRFARGGVPRFDARAASSSPNVASCTSRSAPAAAATVESHGRVSPVITTRRPLRVGPTSVAGSIVRPSGSVTALALGEPAPERALGDPHLAREFGIEPPAAFFLDERVADRGLRAMLDGEREDRISLARDRRARRDLGDLERKGEPLDAEAVGALEERVKPRRAPEAKRFGARLQRERAQQAEDAEDVIGVVVREEEVVERERDAVAHHLALGALAAVDEQRFALADEGERRDAALDGGAGGGGAEEAEGEAHPANLMQRE